MVVRREVRILPDVARIMTYQAVEIVIYKTAILCKRDIHIQDSHIVWGIYLASARIDRLTVD